MIEILQCEEYVSDSVCAKCVSGYFVQNSRCSEVPAVLNCAVYDNSNGEDKGKCTQCTDAFYLDADQSNLDSQCVARVKSNQFPSECTVLDIHADVCTIAKSTTVFREAATPDNEGNFDKDHLFVTIDANCDQSSTSNYVFNEVANGTEVTYTTTCQQCVDGYFRVTDNNSLVTCNQGDITSDHCEKFSQTAVNNADNAVCTQCEQGFYLDTDECKANLEGMAVSDCDV